MSTLVAVGLLWPSLSQNALWVRAFYYWVLLATTCFEKPIKAVVGLCCCKVPTIFLLLVLFKSLHCLYLFIGSACKGETME
jgi:hypothetical protein